MAVAGALFRKSILEMRDWETTKWLMVFRWWERRWGDSGRGQSGGSYTGGPALPREYVSSKFLARLVLLGQGHTWQTG